MKISLIHPSRSRPKMAKKNLENWMNKISGNHTIEHILSIDESDPHKDEYYALFLDGYSIIVCADNTCVVEAANAGAEFSKGEVLIYLSDDFDCPQNWDQLIIDKIGYRENVMLRVNDLLQPMANCVLTIPIVTRSLYKELGYFFFPEYKSMWVDCDLYFTTKPYMIEAPELEFKHKHMAEGNDETYQRSAAHWNQGVDIFNRRSKEFGWGRAFNRV